MADVLARRGDLAPLRARADAGDERAAARLVRVLAERADVEGLRLEVAAGLPGALEALSNTEAVTGRHSGDPTPVRRLQ